MHLGFAASWALTLTALNKDWVRFAALVVILRHLLQKSPFVIILIVFMALCMMLLLSAEASDARRTSEHAAKLSWQIQEWCLSLIAALG